LRLAVRLVGAFVGWLVAGGVVWPALLRASRYSLIVASIEHKFSSGYCRVYPDLLDAAGIELRRPPCAAADLFSVTHEFVRVKKCFGGLAFWGTAVHLCDPQ
jgi:hypothetical protein